MSDIFCNECMGHGTLPNPIYEDRVFVGFGPRRRCWKCDGRGFAFGRKEEKAS